MRKALFALMAIGTLTAIDSIPAQARDYPVCMRTRFDQDDCSYVNYAQCMASASGLGQSCFQNPANAYNRQRYGDEPVLRRRHRHHRHAH